MKKLVFILLIVWSFAGYAQKDTVYYFGVNGKIIDPVKKIVMKKVNYRGNKKIRVKTYMASDGDWKLVYTEKIKIISDSVYSIKTSGESISEKITRYFKPVENGFEFTDKTDKIIKRTGTTIKKIPLILEGTVTENYNSGKIKSISEYHDNELVSNKNWGPDGIQLVDNIFYSVDSEPNFVPGLQFINQQIRKAIKYSKFDLETVNGTMVVGLVITTDGKIGGVQIIRGISQVLSGIIADALLDVKGAWFPAKLNGKDVNYLQTFPINFVNNRETFDYLEVSGGVMQYTTN